MKITKFVVQPAAPPPPRYVIELTADEFNDLVRALNCNITAPRALRAAQLPKSAEAYQRSCQRICGTQKVVEE